MESASFYQIDLKQAFNTAEENRLLQKVTSFFEHQTEHTDVRNLAEDFEKLISEQTLSGHFLYVTFTKYTATIQMKLNGHYKGAWVQISLDKDLQD